MQRRSLLVAGASVLALGALAGCKKSAEIENIVGSAYKLPAAKLRTVIIQQGTRLGWRVIEDKPGLVVLKYVKEGRHIAVVNVNYNDKGFEIKPNHQSNMINEDGTVNPKLNQWMRNLRARIEAAASAGSL